MAVWFTLFFASLIMTMERSYGTKLYTRQDTCDATICSDPQVVAFVETSFTPPINATFCTDCVMAKVAACSDCDDQIGQGDEQEAQEALSGLVDSCNAAGFHVKNVTVIGAYAAAGGDFRNSNFDFPACGAAGQSTSIGGGSPSAGDGSPRSGVAGPSQSQTKPNGGNARETGSALLYISAMLGLLMVAV
ncbi:hypothetical protein B0H13DRAFT_1896125 [Mycena leptocephala]|nr:hypothetical protein B0H13DRAFT_1896125 [Mycena leptocephala]